MSRRTLSREPFPGFVAPMLLCSGAPERPVPGEWAVEVKFDGIRAQLRVDGGRGWRVRSRPGRDCSSQFPELAAVASELAGHRVILDGELVHLAADGRPDFGLLRRRLSAHGTAAAEQQSVRHPASLIIFDVLHLDGYAVRALAYEQRRALLRELVADGPNRRLAPSWTERLDDVLAVTREHELEGVVYKRLNSTYRPGRRSNSWRKHKHRRDETLAVSAWTPGDREPDTFYLTRSAPDGQPRYAGTVQLGLSGDERERLRGALTQLESATQRRRRIRTVQPGVSLVVSTHGAAAAPLRDAVIRQVIVEPTPGAQ